MVLGFRRRVVSRFPCRSWLSSVMGHVAKLYNWRLRPLLGFLGVKLPSLTSSGYRRATESLRDARCHIGHIMPGTAPWPLDFQIMEEWDLVRRRGRDAGRFRSPPAESSLIHWMWSLFFTMDEIQKKIIDVRMAQPPFTISPLEETTTITTRSPNKKDDKMGKCQETGKGHRYNNLFF